MPTRKTTTTVSSVLAGALLLAPLAPLAACSGGGGSAEASGTSSDQRDEHDGGAAAAFCSGAQDLYDQFLAAGNSAPTSPEMQGVYASAQRLEPPEEIASDWQLVLDSLAPVMTGRIDVDDPAAMQQFTLDLAADAASYQRVGTYVGEVCGIHAAPTTTAPTPAP